MLCVAEPVRRGHHRVSGEPREMRHRRREVVARVHPHDGGGAKIELPQLCRGVLDIVRAARDARGVTAELLSEPDRDGILQMRAAHLEDVVERAGFP